jgi:signal transduction histidine kinase
MCLHRPRGITEHRGSIVSAPITGPKTYRRHDTAAEQLPENVRRRLERELTSLVTVVDDTGDLISALKPLLPEGWSVRGFKSQVEALASLSVDTPIAVIASMDAKSFDGVGLLREVASTMPDIRRILATERAGASEMLTAVNEIGVHRVIASPLNSDLVAEALEGAYAQRRRELAVEYLLEDARAQNAQLSSARTALEERESHLLHSERLAVLGRLTDGLAAGIEPLLDELSQVVSRLTSDNQDPDHDDLLSIGHDAVESIWDIIEDIGRFTRDDHLELRREPIELGEMVRRTARFASFDRRIRLRTLVVDADPRIQASIDARRVRQVLLNLLRNAADATNEGAKIMVTLRREVDWAEIAVTDEGTGMPQQVLNLVFEEFFSTKGQEGLGLGLALCRSTIVQHGGEITCKTALGVGTTFTVRLPLLD